MNKFQEFQESFFKHLRELFDLIKGKNGDELDEALAAQARSEEERQVILDMCRDIDTEHQLLNEMKESGKSPEDWFEQQLEREAKEIEPEAAAEDVEYLEDAVEQSMATEIGQLTEDYVKSEELLENINKEAADADAPQDGKEETGHE